jgi:hypothetical protein
VRQTSKQTASANPKPADDPVTIRDYSAFNLTADRFICHMEYVEVHAPFESPAGAPKLLPDGTNSGVTVWISTTFHCTVRTLRLSLTRILTVTSSCPDGSLGSQLQLRRVVLRMRLKCKCELLRSAAQKLPSPQCCEHGTGTRMGSHTSSDLVLLSSSALRVFSKLRRGIEYINSADVSENMYLSVLFFCFCR